MPKAGSRLHANQTNRHSEPKPINRYHFYYSPSFSRVESDKNGKMEMHYIIEKVTTLQVILGVVAHTTTWMKTGEWF